VAQTFLEKGYSPEKLARHQYGFDPTEFYPSDNPRPAERPFTMLFVGGLSPVKGLHYAFQAWGRSPASNTGIFLIAGDGSSEYIEMLAEQRKHPSVKILGQRRDVPELMRQSDVLVLPSLSEGFPLVVAEAIGSGCVPLVSDRITDACKHMQNALVHPVGDISTLSEHITLLDKNRDLLVKLRTGCLKMAPEVTWTAAGARLLDVYRDVIAAMRH
jgi:glycosyltransferase involved in cell wall biosynthesis